MEKLLKPLFVGITGIIHALGYGGIVLMMAIESANIPVPSEIIMPYGGYLVFRYPGEFHLVWMGAAGALGCLLGSWLSYALGYYGGRPLVLKYGRYVLLKKRDLDAADRFFNRYGDWAIFVSRLLPIVRTFISLPAGISRMPFWRFTLFTFVGSFPWCYLLAMAGFKLGEQWESIKRYFHGADVVMGVVIVVFFGLWLWHRRRPEPEAAV